MLWVPAYSSSHFTDSLTGSDCSPRSDRGSLTRVTFGHRHRAHHATLLRSRAETKAAALPTPPTPAKPLQKPAETAPSPAPTIPAPKAQPPEAQPPKTPAPPKAPTAAPDAPALTTPPAPPPLPAAKTLPVVAPTPPSPAPPTPEPATPAQPKPPVLKSDGWKNPFSLTPAPEAPSPPALPRPPVKTKKLPGSAAASPETVAIAETITDAGSPADTASATTGPTANEWRVQFAAFRNAREAERALEKLNSRAGAEIGRTPRIIDVADLGDRGIFHRIQAGPLDGREAAEKLCTLVKAVLPQQDCVPVQIKGR